MKWSNPGVNYAWNDNERLNIYERYKKDDIYFNPNLRDKYVNEYFVMPRSITVIIEGVSYLFVNKKVLYEARGNKINLYQYESGYNIILKLQKEPSVDSDGTCGLIRSEKIAELSFYTGEPKVRTLYINLMQGFTADLNDLSKGNKQKGINKYVHIQTGPEEGDINIFQLYQRIKNMLICLRDKGLYYIDLKLQNIFVCLDIVNGKNEFSFYLGDIDSAVRLKQSGPSTYPTPELADPDVRARIQRDLRMKEDGLTVIRTQKEGNDYLSWQLGATMLQLYSQKMADRLYWGDIENLSVAEIKKIVNNIMSDLEKRLQIHSGSRRR